MTRRASTVARGYGSEHKRLRGAWAPRVATGTVRCWRCGELIDPDEQWDLGHDDDDRQQYKGPEHAGRCNRRAAAIRSNRRRGNGRRASGAVASLPPISRRSRAW